MEQDLGIITIHLNASCDNSLIESNSLFMNRKFPRFIQFSKWLINFFKIKIWWRTNNKFQLPGIKNTNFGDRKYDNNVFLTKTLRKTLICLAFSASRLRKGTVNWLTRICFTLLCHFKNKTKQSMLKNKTNWSVSFVTNNKQFLNGTCTFTFVYHILFIKENAQC